MDLDKPDLIIAWCNKCREFSIEQPNGTILQDDVMEREITKEDHNGKLIKLYLRRPIIIGSARKE